MNSRNLIFSIFALMGLTSLNPFTATMKDQFAAKHIEGSANLAVAESNPGQPA